MNVGSLFSGIGGLDLGLARAGLSHRWFCEINPYRRRILARHFPGVPIYEDVACLSRGGAGGGAQSALRSGDGGGASSDIDLGESPLGEGAADPDLSEADGGASRSGSRELGGGAGGIDPQRERGSGASLQGVDLICGGFPCQDLSSAGLRAGLEGGERSRLFFDFARIADAVLPAGGWILIENVPGLLSSNDGRDFAILLAELAQLGFYDCAWRLLDSRYFGVPQRRRRIFILARRARGARASEVLLEPESGGGDFEASARSGEGSDAPRGAAGGAGADGPVQSLTSRSGATGPDYPDAEAGWLGDFSGPITRRIGKGINTTLDDGAAILSDQEIDPDRMREAPRTAGWMDDRSGLDLGPDGPRYSACGDAVSVPVAEWIGRRLMEHA